MVTTELLKITAVGPYGVNSGGTWYKLGKGMTVGMFQRGSTYSVEVYTGTKGGKFINKVIQNITSVPTEPLLNPQFNSSAPILEVEKPKDTRPLNEYGKPVSDYAIAKDQRIARSGVIQAAVQAMSGHVSNREQLEKEGILLAEAMLKWVKE